MTRATHTTAHPTPAHATPARQRRVRPRLAAELISRSILNPKNALRTGEREAPASRNAHAQKPPQNFRDTRTTRPPIPNALPILKPRAATAAACRATPTAPTISSSGNAEFPLGPRREAPPPDAKKNLGTPKNAATPTLTHTPVLLHEVLTLLSPAPNAHYLDATFGGGGHTRAILEAAPNTHVHAYDRDPAAAPRAAQLAHAYPTRLHFTNTNFTTLADTPADSSFNPSALQPLSPFLSGALFDLGLSTYQLDTPARGFTFRADAPADMRMDPRTGPPASTWLETAPEPDLARALRDYAEEPHWRRVLRAILAARGTGALARTTTLAALIADAIPPRDRHTAKIHPATRAFQGIRIALNDELTALTRALPAAFALLAPGAVLIAISFHSLEDRIVKQTFRRLCAQPTDSTDSTPQQFRDHDKRATPLTRKPLTPAPAELAANPRSRSAKLRAIRKL